MAHLFVEPLRAYAIERRKIRVERNLLAANEEDPGAGLKREVLYLGDIQHPG